MTHTPALVSCLGYVGVATRQLSEWDRFARRVLGVHIDQLATHMLRLRLDKKICRFLVQSADYEGAAFFGWEIAENVTLGEVAAALEARGIRTDQGSNNECEDRGVNRLLWFRDPLGYRVEVFQGHRDAPPSSGLKFERPLSGFKTGALGLGHAVLMSANVTGVRGFYLDVMGMRLSDYTEKPFEAQFFHVNPRHHSFAVIKNAREGLHHIMLELLELDDVGQTYDLLETEGVRLGASLGRHTNDFMTSFYMCTPSGFMIEYGWGGRQIDMQHWIPERLDCGPSFWGHERTWLDETTRRQAADLRQAAARSGLKAKVVVTSGHFVETATGETG